jgi:hypothetical protein
MAGTDAAPCLETVPVAQLAHSDVLAALQTSPADASARVSTFTSVLRALAEHRVPGA